jgi:predicted aldo/keto reductase-like oxidoreductase
MLYRKLGKTGLDVSLLGFGCMRLPLAGGSRKAIDSLDPTKPIDEEEAIRMVHYAIDHGINYFDTAYPYHGGKSEIVLGKAIKGSRDKVYIATKLPARSVERANDFDRFLQEQIQKLDTTYLDIYLLHGLNRPVWHRMKDMGVLDFLRDIVADGRARYVGFSFHDDVKIFKEIVDSYDWGLCQIQYNYFDENYQAGKEGLMYAASKGLGVVIMEPLRGGKLTQGIPAQVQAIWDSAKVKRTPAEWGLRWVWNHNEVSIALSGMSNMEQLKENVSLADKGLPNSLTEEDLDLIHRVAKEYKQMLEIDCTGCAYCVPCPNGVNIPVIFSLYNDTFVFKRDARHALSLYDRLLTPEQQASNCAECGECEEQCPQQIMIIEELKKVHQSLTQGRSDSR